MSDLMIRQANQADTLQLVQLYSQLSSETSFLTEDVNEKPLDRQIEQMASQINQYEQHPTSLMLIAEWEGQIIALGTLATLPGTRQYHVAELGIGVLKDHWGNGIASILLDELIAFAETTPLKVLTLEVVQANERAVGLYKKFNFNIVGSLSKRLYTDETYYDTYLMERLI